MTPERWEQVGQLYQAALELQPGERTSFLRQACGEDESLCREVESLLAAEQEAGDFLAAGAIDDAAKALAEEKTSRRWGNGSAITRCARSWGLEGWEKSTWRKTPNSTAPSR